MGRDGNVVAPEKMHVVSITMLGKYRVEATINPQHQIQRIKTTVSEPAIGDFNIEQESTEQTSFGNIKWPIAWHSHQGWDDNWQFASESPATTLTAASFRTCSPRVRDPVPGLSRFAAPRRIRPVRSIDGGRCISTRRPTHNSTWWVQGLVAVFEAPLNETRSLAVIEEVVKLAPAKPIRWLISSHPHFDHIGGLRTYLHIGATIVTHRKAIDFLNRDVLNYRPRTIAPDIVALWPPTELSEGYNFEAINENYVITDNSRILRVYYVQPRRSGRMVMAYLPEERLASRRICRHAESATGLPTTPSQLYNRCSVWTGRGHDRAGAWQPCRERADQSNGQRDGRVAADRQARNAFAR